MTMQSYLQYRLLGKRLKQQSEKRCIDELVNHKQRSSSNPPQALPTSDPTSTGTDNDCISVNGLAAPLKVGEERGEEDLIIVNLDGPSDPLNPQTWSTARKWTYTFLIGATGFIVSGAAAFDTPATPQAAEYFGVSQEIALLATTLYMIALGLGSMVSAPFSETVGRNPVYIVCEWRI